MGPNFTPLTSSAGTPPPPPKQPNRKAFTLLAVGVLLVGVVAGYFAISSNLLYRSNASGDPRFDDTIKNPSAVTAVNSADPPLCSTCTPPLPVSTSKTVDVTQNTSGKWVSDWLCGTNSTPNAWCRLVVDNATFKVGPGKLKVIITARHWNSGPDGDEGFMVSSSIFNGILKATGPATGTAEKTYTTATDIPMKFDHNVFQAGSVQATVDWVFTPNQPSNTPTPTLTKTPTPSPTRTPTPNPSCGSTCTSDSQCPTAHKCLDPNNINNTSSTNKKCILTKCTENGVVCDSTKCNVIPPTPTNVCPKPNPVKNLRINCPICKGQ